MTLSEFLKMHGAYDEYVKYLRDTPIRHADNAISSAFYWGGTSRHATFWSNLDIAWRNTLGRFCDINYTPFDYI